MNPIVGIGELLWDIYPDGHKVAGGAPFNFAFHCHQLGHPAVIVSRVGDDDLGRELRNHVRRLGVSDEYIQTDHEHPTGTVQVVLDRHGVPTFRINENVAWDHARWTDDLARLAGRTRGVCFGTLGQRSADSADTIVRFVQSAGSACGGAYRILDVNLRQSYFTPVTLKSSIYRAPVVKVGEDELRTLSAVVGLPGVTTAERVRSLFRFSPAETRFVYVTRGPDGADAYFDGDREPIHMPGVQARVIDTVGAGDAFTAAVTCLTAEGRSVEQCVRFATHYAARVCEYQGGTPAVDRSEVERRAFGTGGSSS